MVKLGRVYPMTGKGYFFSLTCSDVILQAL